MALSPSSMVPSEGKSISKANIWGFAAMVVGMFMAILDIQIVASSLSEIQAGVSATRDEITWVQTSYLIAEVIIIPLSGWLARVFSTRWTFFLSSVSFTLASVACALSWNLESLIVFRALQGFLGGLMIPSVFATSFLMFSPEQRPSVTILIGLVTTMAPTLGPTLGGWITETFSWHWLFLINLIPGIFVSVTVFLTLRVDTPNLSLLKKIDFPGIILVALFLGTLQYVLEEGSRNDWFSDPAIATLFVISVFSAVLFLWRELTTTNPVIDLRLFSDRNFLFGCLFSFIIGVGLYGAVYLLPVFLGTVRGYSAMQIGWVVMVTGLFQFISSPIVGRLSVRIPSRLMLALGLGLFGLSLFINHFLTAEWGYWEFFIAQALRGGSMLLMFMPVNTLALGMLPPQKLQNASGLYNLTRNLGGAIGLAIINTILIRRENMHYQVLRESLTEARIPVTETLNGLQNYFAPSLGSDAPMAAVQVVSNVIVRESIVIAFADIFMLLVFIYLFALLLIPFVKDIPIGRSQPAEAH